jgi:acetyltransferase-like isoleucine patch superfamily enzyme
MPKWKTHGAGLDFENKLGSTGKNVIIENGAKLFFPENIEIGDDVYIGHDTILKAYFDKHLKIGSGTWIGPQCFIYASGGITIGKNVGIGPGVKIMSSAHVAKSKPGPILHRPIAHAPVILDDGCDIGAGSVILMGVHIGKEVQIGAGAVVTMDIPDGATAAGVPARIIKSQSTIMV